MTNSKKLIKEQIFAESLKVGDLVNISTKDKPYIIVNKKFAGDEPRFGPLWFLSLEEAETGDNKHDDYIKLDGTSTYYFRSIKYV